MKYVYAINIRRLMNPPLPKGYWGNGCVPMYAQIKAGELIEQPIWKTAELIKQSKSNASDEYVRSFIDFQELHHKDGINAGTGNIYNDLFWKLREYLSQIFMLFRFSCWDHVKQE